MLLGGLTYDVAREACSATLFQTLESVRNNSIYFIDSMKRPAAFEQYIIALTKVFEPSLQHAVIVGSLFNYCAKRPELQQQHMVQFYSIK